MLGNHAIFRLTFSITFIWHHAREFQDAIILQLGNNNHILLSGINAACLMLYCSFFYSEDAVAPRIAY